MGRINGSRNINSRIKTIVLILKKANPKWSASRIRNYLINHVDEYKPLKKIDIPSVRSIQIILKEGLKRLGKLCTEQDEYWTIGSMKDFPTLSPTILPRIFELKAAGGYDLTIRQAKWMSRLCFLPLSTGALYQRAKIYSVAEIIAEVMDTKLTTFHLDRRTEEVLTSPELSNETIPEFEVLDRFTGLIEVSTLLEATFPKGANTEDEILDDYIKATMIFSSKPLEKIAEIIKFSNNGHGKAQPKNSRQKA